MRIQLQDPIETNEAELVERQADDDREQRWSAFVADVKVHARHLFGVWPELIRSVGDAFDPRYSPELGSFEWRCLEFAETEGFDGTLNAVARAIREEQGAR